MAAAATPPPLPALPVPSYTQLQWQLSEMALFLHFGPNTFTDSEWGSGHADPAVFAPFALDAGQWARVPAEGGFGRVVLTAKHHDGFCLWPSALTDYSVAASPWQEGAGDVVGELAAAARAEGIGLGLYLSRWDRHEPVYGDTVAYNEREPRLGVRWRQLLQVAATGPELAADTADGLTGSERGHGGTAWTDARGTAAAARRGPMPGQ